MADPDIQQEIECLVLSLEFKLSQTGKVEHVRAYLPMSTITTMFSQSTILALMGSSRSGEPIDGFWNIANLIKVRGLLEIGLFTLVVERQETDVRLSAELLPTETIDADSLLLAAEHLAPVQGGMNPHTVKVERPRSTIESFSDQYFKKFNA